MKPNWNIRIAMAVLAVLIAVRPGLPSGEDGRVPVGSNLQVLFVVDETLSMSALDHAGVRSRLEGVREDLGQITKALPDSQFALIGFGHDAQLDLPFTSDPGAISRAVTGIAREPMMSGTGTVLDRPLALMQDVLAGAAKQHPDRRQVVIFASDGENTLAGARQASYSGLGKYIDEGAVLGYGTIGGGRMPTGGEPPWTFVTDHTTGEDAVSHADEQNLRKIAKQLGVEYAYRGGSGDLTEWASGLARGGEAASAQPDDKREVYWILALILAGLAIVELRLDVAAWRAAKEVAG
jgi:Ca-activated chloride channel family protein